MNSSYTSPCQVAEKLVSSKGPLYDSNNIFALWLQLFYDILNDEYLT
jgi:hypothetical protein